MGLCIGVSFEEGALQEYTLNDSFFSHLRYTIPPALLLSFVLAPLLTRTDVYKVSFLITAGFTLSLAKLSSDVVR